nr:transposase [Serratia bockelmannii]
MLRRARQQGSEVGIFCALHTYGRQLNQHPHIHVSVTCDGFDIKHNIWRALFFKKKEVKTIWCNAVIYLLRDNYAHMRKSIPAACLASAISVTKTGGTIICMRNIAAPGRCTSLKRPATPGAV